MARVSKHARALGITRVANVTGLDHVGIPVVAVYRPNARSIVVSQGKGIDLWAAKASGLMEAAESFHAEHCDLALRLRSYAEMTRVRPVVDVSRLPRVSVTSFHADRPLSWCAGVDLMQGDGRGTGPESNPEVWVPYEMVHTNFTLPLPTGSGCFTMSSNGLASGNHLTEAINHGICELIERDALALWAMRGGSHSREGRVLRSSIDDPHCLALLARLDAAGLAYGIWDIRTDIAVPCFACVSVDREPNPVGQVFVSHGSGAHANPGVALSRAISEAAQTRLTFIAGARDDADRAFFERARDPARARRALCAIDELEDPGEPLGVQGSAPHRDFQAIQGGDTDSFEGDLAWLEGRLRAVGIDELVAVDLGQPRFDLSVVRMIIPGLESLHDIPGYVPGARVRARSADPSAHRVDLTLGRAARPEVPA